MLLENVPTEYLHGVDEGRPRGTSMFPQSCRAAPSNVTPFARVRALLTTKLRPTQHARRDLVLVALLAVASCDRVRPGPRTAFNGEQALAYATTQVQFGPRVPGTQGHRRTGDWI